MALIAVAALSLGVVGSGLLRPSVEPGSIVHFAFDPAADENFASIGRRVIDISPDGRRVAFTDEDAIWLRSLDAPELVEVRGTRDSTSPLFSPDGEWIAFYAEGQLRKVPVGGGAPLRLADLDNPTGTSWESDGTILVGQGAGGIVRVPEDGGVPEQLVELDETERAQGPSLLPGGEWLLFTLRNGGESWNDGRIVAQSLSSGERRLLVSGGTEPRYVASGHLTFARDGSLFAVPFDPGEVEVTGGQVPLIEGVQVTRGSATGGVFYDLSAAGDLVYINGRGAGAGDFRLAFYDLQGNLEVLPFDSAVFANARVSPDGRRLAVDLEGESSGSDIWIYDLERGTNQRLTTGAGASNAPVWSPGGDWVYYRSDAAAEAAVYRIRSDFTGEAEPVGAAVGAAPESISPDGSRLALFIVRDGIHIGILDIETGETELLVHTPAIEGQPRFSPDGRFLAYISNEGDGTFRTYVRELETGVRHVVSPTAGTAPTWSPSGDAIYYLAPGRMLTMVPVEIDSGLTLGTPVPMFAATAVAGFPRTELDFTPDYGQRLLLLTLQEGSRDEEPTEPVRVHVVLNWAQELRRRVTPR